MKLYKHPNQPYVILPLPISEEPHWGEGQLCNIYVVEPIGSKPRLISYRLEFLSAKEDYKILDYNFPV